MHRWRLLAAALIFANVLWFAHAAFSSYFALDDMMNAAGYWITPWWKLVGAQVAFFSSYYRPMGAVFYLPLLRLFGFNPLPFHIVMFVLVLVNTYLAYRVVLLISDSEMAAGLAAFALSYHSALPEVYYSPAVIYDILCFLFYFLALLVYLRIRTRGELPSGRQIALIAILYVCALNSKEMGVSFPIVLLAYELCFHPPALRGLGKWLRTAGRTMAVAGVLTAIYVIGKMLGPDSLSSIAPYRPVITAARFMKSSQEHLTTLTFGQWTFDARATLLLWAAALGIALVRRKPDLRFAWCWVMAAPLPIVFLERAHSCLYIPLAAWSLYVAVALTAASRWAGPKLARRYCWRPLAAILPVAAALTLVSLVYAGNTRGRAINELDMASQGRLAEGVIAQLRTLQPKIRPHSTAIFVNAPFEDWDMIFIAQLWFRDPTITFWDQNKTALPQQEIDRMDYIFRFEKGRLLQIKPRVP